MTESLDPLRLDSTSSVDSSSADDNNTRHSSRHSLGSSFDVLSLSAHGSLPSSSGGSSVSSSVSGNNRLAAAASTLVTSASNNAISECGSAAAAGAPNSPRQQLGAHKQRLLQSKPKPLGTGRARSESLKLSRNRTKSSTGIGVRDHLHPPTVCVESEIETEARLSRQHRPKADSLFLQSPILHCIVYRSLESTIARGRHTH